MSQLAGLLWKETKFSEAFFTTLGFIPIHHACAGKLRDRHYLPPHRHFLLLNGSLRWVSTTQNDGCGARRKRKAFQALGGLSWPQGISGRLHQNTSSTSHLDPLLNHGMQRQGLWPQQHPAQWQTQMGLQVTLLARDTLAKGRPDTVHFKDVNCAVCELYLKKVVIGRKKKKKMEGKKGGREKEGERERKEKVDIQELGSSGIHKL